jgi:hypothetical protein
MGLLGTILGTDQQKAALGRAEDITREQSAASQQAYQNYLAQAMATLSPYQQAAQGVLPQLQQVAGERIDPTMTGFNFQDYMNDPGYQFQLQQGQQGINQASAARGNFFAPATVQGLGQFQQGLAATSYQDAFNRYLQQTQGLFGQRMGGQQQLYNQLAGIYGTGANAAGQVAGMQFGTGQQIGGSRAQLGSDLSNLALARGQINPWGGILKLAGTAAGAYFGGPMGATAGSQLGGGMTATSGPGAYSTNMPPMKV